MSVGAPNPNAPVATPRAAPLTHPTTSVHPDLHSLAVDVVTDLQALGAGLHQSGASPEAVEVITNMTNAVHAVAQHLAQMPPIANPAHAPQPGQELQQAPQAAPGAPQQAPAAPQGAQQDPHKQMGAAIGNLLSAAHSAASQPQGGQ
jgi:hypothetical protein